MTTAGLSVYCDPLSDWLFVTALPSIAEFDVRKRASVCIRQWVLLQEDRGVNLVFASYRYRGVLVLPRWPGTSMQPQTPTIAQVSTSQD